MENNKINVDDLNGVSDTTYKVITKLIQEYDPIKFSSLCEQELKTLNPEAMINYSVSSIPMPTNRGVALVFTCSIQYWGSEEDYKQWIQEIKRNNLLIKP